MTRKGEKTNREYGAIKIDNFVDRKDYLRQYAAIRNSTEEGKARAKAIRAKYYAANKERIQEKIKERKQTPEYKAQARAYSESYRLKNPDKIIAQTAKAAEKLKNPIHKAVVRERERNRARELKLEVIRVYSKGSMCCAYCGYSDVRALELDHIDNNGQAHRKALNNRKTVYQDVKCNNYPDGFQILCSNCNKIKEYERLSKETELRSTLRKFGADI